MSFPVTQVPPVDLSEVMQADRFRLEKAWLRLVRSGQVEAESKQVAEWVARATASAASRQRRAESVPELSYDADLPISAHRQELIELIRSRQTIVVCGETGSGKSTQLPKLCLEAGLGRGGWIGHTQPRRLAARAVASRVSEELGAVPSGNLVGYKIRFSDSTRPGTLVKVMTDGVLLAETQSDRYLDQYEALIIDEAHERSLNIDFLLGYLRRMSGKRPDLKLIITSATIDPQRFAEHFSDELGPAPIVEVSGRTYPVEQRYRPLEVLQDDSGPVDAERMLASIANAVDELMSEGPGDVLVFLPTERDIRETAKHLRGHFTRRGGGQAVDILPLYARLSQAEQDKIFKGHAGRRIVLSTNVAESSLTVPGIHFVIDTGLVRISRYAPRSKVKRLPIEEVSQASANQRSGRCGRLGPGICIRLYSEADFQQRPRFTTPEIRRSDLTSVMLQGLTLQLGPLEEFPLLDPPSPESIRDAQRTLMELGAIDQDRRLTDVGRRLGRLPCEPRVGRMLLEAIEQNCLAEVLVIAAGLECQDVRQRPAGQRPQADEAHAQFLDPHSDFLSLIRLWDFFEHLKDDLGRSKLQKALSQNFLSYQGFREWSDTVRQLREILGEAGIQMGKRKYAFPRIDKSEQRSTEKTNERQQSRNRDIEPEKKLPRPDGYAPIHQALLAGLLSGVAHRGDRHEYVGAGGLKFSLWPGSGLFRRAPKWIMAAEILETNKRYARTVAELDVEWIEVAAQSLLKHSYSDPHWSSQAGAAMVYRRSTLYGLTIVSGRRVAYAPIDTAEARAMMIEHGLVAGDWRCTEEFYRHNRELVADVDELAKRTRSRDYIIDRFHLANFYNARLPVEVFDLNGLKLWLKSNRNTPQAEGLRMRPEDLVSGDAELQSIDKSFPNHLKVDVTNFPLAYHFEPGHPSDGVTITVPDVALRQISEEALGWLVPGLLEEKILSIIKALPKAIRTNFLPAPDVAEKLARELADVAHDQPFSKSLAAAMSRHAGEPIAATSLRATELPEHFRFLVRVVDAEGHELAVGRDIHKLINEFAPSPGTLDKTTISTSGSAEPAWTNTVVTPDNFDGLPGPVVVQQGGVRVAAYPALFDLGPGVELRLANSLKEAELMTRKGITRLFGIKHNRILRGHIAHLPEFSESCLRLSHLVGGKQLQEQLQLLLVRVALVENQPDIATRQDFDERNRLASAAISMAAQELAGWLPKLAIQAHELRLRLEQAPKIWSKVTGSICDQQSRLFWEDFLRDTPWEWLSEMPRYLAATQQRLEKLKSGGLVKEARLSEPIEQAEAQLRALEADAASLEPTQADRLRYLRWMLEELRVSVFAQQLGTKHSVSPKRMAEWIAALK